MEQKLLYARLVTPDEIGKYHQSIREKNAENYEKAKPHLIRHSEEIIKSYHQLDQKFEEIQEQNISLHSSYVKALHNKKCICGADVVYVESHQFWGCTNYMDAGVEHRNFIEPNPWDYDRYLKEPHKVNTSDWLRTIKEMAGIERKLPHSSLFKFLLKNGLRDLSDKYEGLDSWNRVNRLKIANKKAKWFEGIVGENLVGRYGRNRVFPQQGIKFQYEGSESRYNILDFLVMDDENNTVIIVECKLSSEGIDEIQREQYLELVASAMRTKGLDMGLEFKFEIEDDYR